MLLQCVSYTATLLRQCILTKGRTFQENCRSGSSHRQYMDQMRVTNFI